MVFFRKNVPDITKWETTRAANLMQQFKGLVRFASTSLQTASFVFWCVVCWFNFFYAIEHFDVFVITYNHHRTTFFTFHVLLLKWPRSFLIILFCILLTQVTIIKIYSYSLFSFSYSLHTLHLISANILLVEGVWMMRIRRQDRLYLMIWISWLDTWTTAVNCWRPRKVLAQELRDCLRLTVWHFYNGSGH